MEDEEYKKLPIEERCIHKLWKARVNGYEEVTKLFRQIDDEKSPEFAKYLGLIKKFVTDSNAVSQEKGLEATLAYVENYANAGKTVGEVMSGIVNKCIAAPKAKTRDLALQITFMYIEIEKQDAVLEELIKGMDLKNPKIVAACVNAAATALRDFGAKVITIKPLLKKVTTLLSDRDKTVRDESKALVIEMYRWIGGALRSQMSNLQPVLITELEAEFSKIEGQKAAPTRYLKSQQEKQAKLAAEQAENGDDVDDDGEENNEPVVIDPHEIADPVEILSKLPKDFFTKLEAKKWQERKEALEILENLVKNPKLEAGEYADLIRALIKIVQKDSNVVVVALAAKCLAGLASGLRKRFQPYTSAVIPVLLEKFKEKKQNVVSAVRDAIDFAYVATNIENILEDVLEALNNKNPSVKTETALFLSRGFTKTLPTAFNKKLLKALTGGLIKITNESDPVVRDSSAEALGTLMKLVGEKAVAPFLVELEKDAKKMGKIREFCDKAVIVVKVPGVKKERPATAQPKLVAKVEEKPAAKAPPKRPGTAVTKKRTTDISSGSATIVKSKSSKNIKSASKAVERELSDEEVTEIVTDVLSNEIVNGLADANWKTRLSSVEQFLSQIQSMDGASMPTQALVKTLCKKPGLKDTNFQVLKGRLDAIKYIATNGNFSITSATLCVNDVTDKLGDAKNGAIAGEALTAIAEATTFSHVSNLVIEFAFTQKSPKVLQESLAWMSVAIKEFGFNGLNAKFLIDNAKKGIASTNPAVRSAAIVFFGVLYLYMGSTLHTFLENEKPALRELINVEFEKYENERPPAPIRGVKSAASSNSLDAAEVDDEENGTGGDGPVVNLQDLIPRVDISPQITEALLNELGDKNWKVRNEALLKVSTIITEAKLIKPSIGDLPQVLAQRLVDSNSKIAQTAFNISENMATAMGPPSKQYIRILFPGCLQGLGDSKAWIRTAALSCINTYGDLCAYREFFEAEMIGDALKTGSPTLRCELWGWLAEKLPKIKNVPKEEMMVCIPHLYSNLEDRNADVRKNANEAVLGVMIHIGYESMVKQMEKLKPGSKSVVVAALDKARPNLPAKPAPVKKQATQDAKEEKTVRSGGRSQSTPTKTASKAKTTIAKPVARSKKDEDIDTSPLLVVNNMKHQRTIDESKLKVLKWNFTTPREEFVELLRDQMGNANVNKTLTSNMFHSDFKFHIKAIESLSEDLADNSQALISNLDLILKWLTLRFFDTNPSVLLKGLEYLQSVFHMLNEHKYHMLENEASSFIPYLILKIGDPKDSVRNGVRALIKQLNFIYPVSKVFSYIMEGLKSKNARQRAECLEVLGSIIAQFGINVCQPSPGMCLKEIAKQISDRDNGVRNAALNCVVQAYYLVGDKVYKMVGQISDKDMSLLEERIKRASKKPPIIIPNTTKIDLTQPMNSTIIKSPSSDQGYAMQPDGDEDIDDESAEVEEYNLPEAALPSQVKQEPPRVFNGPFGLEDHLISQLDNMRYDLPQPNLRVFDLKFLEGKVALPTAEDIKATIIPLVPPKPIISTNIFSPTQTRQSSGKSNADLQLEKNISQLASPNPTFCKQAIVEIQEVLEHKGSLMVEYEDKFMTAIATQLKYLSHNDPRSNMEILILYKHILAVFDAFYLNKDLGRKVSIPVLKDVMNQFIELLVAGKLDGVPTSSAYIRVINMHCVKIIERSDHTNIIRAMVQLLHNNVKDNGPLRLTDLLMKCLWRIIKIIPSWGDDIDYDLALLDIHIFLKDYPTIWWKNKQSDTPLRTIKTIVHSMVKLKGCDLMLHLGKIPNPNESEMEAYIMKLIKNLKLDEVKQVPLKTDNARRTLSRSTHTQLTDIFQKIGTKEETKDGLNLLYDFLQQNPDADIEPFLKRSSTFFQGYIQENLKKIELERKAAASTLAQKNDENAEKLNREQPLTAAGGDADGQTLEYYEKRIEMWKKRLGLENFKVDMADIANKDIDYYEKRLKMWKGEFERRFK